jgi:hypothetical protein
LDASNPPNAAFTQYRGKPGKLVREIFSYFVLRVERSWSQKRSRLLGEATPGGYPEPAGVNRGGVVRESFHFLNSVWPSAKDRLPTPL